MNIETLLLNVLKEKQRDFAVDALRRPHLRDGFEYGYRVGVVAGYEAAIDTLLKLIEDEKNHGNDI